jgi:hypothetical protein
MPVILTVLSSMAGAYARPAAVFTSNLERIQSNLPLGLALRLPTQILLTGYSDIEEDKLVVRAFPSETPKSFTVSVFTCERSTHPCLLGSFSVDSQQSISAMQELQRHQAIGERFTLAKNVEGYLIEGPLQVPSYQFSTIMWQQNDMIYTISFPANERESIVFMAKSMASEQPIYNVVAKPLP